MNILIHATLFPESEHDKRPNTSMFLYYYVREWHKAGHRVLVLHHQTRFPPALTRVFSVIARLPGLGRARDYLSGYQPAAEGEFDLPGAHVARKSMTKWIPRTLPSQTAIARQARWSRDTLRANGFAPDLVLCDFLSPGLLVALDMIRTINAPVPLIVHNTDMEYFARRLTRARSLKAARAASMLVFRSESARNDFSQAYFRPNRSLIMPSGLPSGFRTEAVPRTKVRGILFVGQLVSRKRAHDLITAFGRLSQNDITLEIVGDGPERETLTALAARQPNAARITFSGKLARGEVIGKMNACDCFVMISDAETFGMTYIEAMSCGMITIASQGGSMEGIIRQGENGFLVKPGDTDALAARLSALIRAESSDVSRVSSAAMQSTAQYRDDLLAREALDAFVSSGSPEGISEPS